MNTLPKLERYITDFTNTLTTDELNELEAIAENYAEKTTNQLVAVVIPDRQGRELFDIGIKLFNENGIGSQTNNGLLLLVANEEKKIRIIV
ncbi:MAG: TPM domain-containing protein [Candidatus Peribacteria bacterium]|nr:TPM domain-containing protein [Candidatus Peribacteria bacterium]